MVIIPSCPRSNALRGNALRGNALRGSALRGNTLRGNTLRGNEGCGYKMRVAVHPHLWRGESYSPLLVGAAGVGSTNEEGVNNYKTRNYFGENQTIFQ